MPSQTLPLPLLPRLDLRRIAADAFTVAIHIGALMVLLAPIAPPAAELSEPAEPPVMTVVPTFVPRPPLPLPPRPPEPRPPVPSAAPPLPLPPAPAPAVSTDTSPLDTYAPQPAADPVIDTDGNGEPPLADLAYDQAPAPRYPPRALRARLTGTVILRLLVDAQGRVQSVQVEQSSGHRLLDDAALDTVSRRWRFHPAQHEGQAIAAYALVPIVFSLPD